MYMFFYTILKKRNMKTFFGMTLTFEPYVIWFAKVDASIPSDPMSLRD